MNSDNAAANFNKVRAGLKNPNGFIGQPIEEE